jgi:acetyltransferase-like isoleucine patch superfamily enzyme
MSRLLDMALRLAGRSDALTSLLSRAVVSAVGAFKSIQSVYHDYAERPYYEAKAHETAQAVGSGLYINGKIDLNSNTRLGENVHLHGLNVRGSGAVTIGNNVHAGTNCKILTANHNYEDGSAIPYDDTFVVKPVTIEDCVWLGIDVTLLPGVTIGEGAIVQAGSVVTHDIPKGAIAGGHPAEVFGQRDMDHYKTLKSAGKFN